MREQTQLLVRHRRVHLSLLVFKGKQNYRQEGLTDDILLVSGTCATQPSLAEFVDQMQMKLVEFIADLQSVIHCLSP